MAHIGRGTVGKTRKAETFNRSKMGLGTILCSFWKLHILGEGEQCAGDGLPRLTTLVMPLFPTLRLIMSGGRLESGHGGNIYTMAISNCYKPAPLFFPTEMAVKRLSAHHWQQVRVVGRHVGERETPEPTKNEL